MNLIILYVEKSAVGSTVRTAADTVACTVCSRRGESLVSGQITGPADIQIRVHIFYTEIDRIAGWQRGSVCSYSGTGSGKVIEGTGLGGSI